MTTEQKDHLATKYNSIPDLLKDRGYTINGSYERFEKWGSYIPFRALAGWSVRGFLDLAEKEQWITLNAPCGGVS